MSHQLYVVQKLISESIDSGGFYSFIYRLKERVDNLTRSFNLSFVLC